MKFIIKAWAVLCVTVLIGCSDTGGNTLGGGAGGGSQGSVDDPTSEAYFEASVGDRVFFAADEQGTREYNLALGARRANAVREYLIGAGVGGDRIQTLSYGKERPVEICSLERCYAQNRRGVTVLNNIGF